MTLFVALWPDSATRAAIAQWQRAWHWPLRAAPVRAERLHITLHFLGDVPGERLGEIAAGLQCPFEPFELEFGHGVAQRGVQPFELGRRVRGLEHRDAIGPDFAVPELQLEWLKRPAQAASNFAQAPRGHIAQKMKRQVQTLGPDRCSP